MSPISPGGAATAQALAEALPPESMLALIGRVVTAPDLAVAAAHLAEQVATLPGADRVLVLMRDGRELRGIAGVRWEPGRPEDVRVAASAAEHPANRAAETRKPVTVAGPAARTEEGTLWTAIPCPDDAACGSAWAMLLVAHEAAAVLDLDTLQLLAGHLGPALARIAELERSRRLAPLRPEAVPLASLLHSLPHPVLVTDAERRIRFQNRRAEQLFVVAPDAPDERRRIIEINHLAFSSFLGQPPETVAGADARELWLLNPAGGDLLFEVLSTPITGGPLRSDALVSVLHDITDLRQAIGELERQVERSRRAERAAARERDQLALILDSAGDPVVVSDGSSRLVRTNPAADRLFRLADAAADAAADPTNAQRVRANHARLGAVLTDLLLRSDTRTSADIRLAVPDDGREFPARVVAGKVVGPDGEVAAAVAVIHDRSEAEEKARLAAELAALNADLERRVRVATALLEERNRRLEEQRSQLEQQGRLKSEFLASMSHELRTPLNAILGYTSLIQEGVYGSVSKQQGDSLERVSRASRHLLELINDVLDLAKIEAGRMPIHPEPVDLPQVITEVGETVAPLVRAKGLHFEARITEGIPPLVSDRTRLRQILLNLLSNAVKFTERGGVTVTARSENGGVLVEVADTGIGISVEHLDSVFETFRQVDGSSTRQHGGTGLGLAITRKLLELLGGSIRLRSEVGQGSVFTIWLPLQTPADNSRK